MKQLLQPSLKALTMLLLTISFLSATAEELNDITVNVNHVKYIIMYTGKGANADGKEAHVWYWEPGIAENLSIESSVSAEITYEDENKHMQTKTISAPVKKIRGRAFTWGGEPCPVKSITIPNTVIEIEGLNTFNNALTTITIGSNVKKIGQQAFYDCNNLKTIICYATTPPEIDGITFNNYNAKLYVPDNYVNDYKTHPIWKRFKDNIFGISMMPNTN